MRILKPLFGAGLLAASLLSDSPSAQAQTPSGCIAWWKAEGNLQDSIGSHHGAATNQPYGPGRIGQAFSFNGTNQLLITNVTDLSFGSGGFSFALWVKKQSPTNNCVLISKYNTSAAPFSREYQFVANESGDFALTRIQNNNSGNRTIKTTELLLNDTNWHHLAVTFDPAAGLDGVALYFDGWARATTNQATGSYTTMQASTEPVRIGSSLGSSGYDFTRALYDEIMIFNRALSASEVRQVFEYGNASVGLMKAVKPFFSNLSIGSAYQLQVSGDLNTWTNQGSVFTATDTNMIYPQYWDVDNWGKLFFRLFENP